MQLTFLADLKK